MKAIAVEHVSRNFQGLMAVNKVTFDIQQGEKAVIIGPNGAGKTTLFNVISGEIHPTYGAVYIFGKDVTNLPSNLRAHLGLARTFQITNLFTDLTVRENILLAALGTHPSRTCMHYPVDSLTELREKISELIIQYSLKEAADTLVRNLSYGVQRQVEVVMALATNARILLLDEPSSGLSPAETAALSSILLGLDSKMTLLIIEHDIDVAFSLADRVIVLCQGRILAEGPPAEIANDARVKSIYLGEE